MTYFFIFAAVVFVWVLLANRQGNRKYDQSPPNDNYVERKYSSPSRNDHVVLPSSFPTTAKEITLSFIYSDQPITESKYLILDVETDGLPRYRDASAEDLSNWPYVVQIAWALFDQQDKVTKHTNYIIKPRAPIPQQAAEIHGITTQQANAKGLDPVAVFYEFIADLRYVDTVVAHNIDFDVPIVEAELIRNGYGRHLISKSTICTMRSSVKFCELPNPYRSGYKFPTLSELYGCLFYNNSSVQISGIHDAEVDLIITAQCYVSLSQKQLLQRKKGKQPLSSPLYDMIYNPDEPISEQPVFERLKTKHCDNENLLWKHSQCKKNIFANWRKLQPKNDIGVYGTDRARYLNSIKKYSENLETCVLAIKQYEKPTSINN